MKRFKYIIIFVSVFMVLLVGMIISVNVLNSDLYGRLIETKKIKLFNSEKEGVNYVPKITLILHKYIEEENSIEASLILNYDNQKVFDEFKTDTLEFRVNVVDGYNYSQLDNTFNFKDSIKRNTYGNFYSGFTTDRFLIPVAPSLSGFPYDDIKIRPMINLFINGWYNPINFEIQKRIPGRILSFSEKDKEIVSLTRTSTEKYFVMISSIIFLLLTVILTYRIITSTGLNTIEELIAVAGYVLATAGFKEMVGINRSNGTSALEIAVILIPLLLLFSGLVYSLYKAKRNNK